MREQSHNPAGERIGRADSFKELLELRVRLSGELAAGGILFCPDAEDANGLVNSLLDGVIRRAIELAERDMREAGAGEPPVPYAFLLFGSGGRREQTLWSDQDNGIVYADASPGAERAAADYFAALGGRIAQGLTEAGSPPCEGGVMCTNPQWRKPLSAWLRMVEEWEADASWEAVRYLLIQADMRCVYGSQELAERIRQSFFAYTAVHRPVLGRMLQNTMMRKVPLNLFGQLVTERYGEEAGGIEIKYSLYIPFVNGVRMLAIRHGIRETSTLGRLTALEKARAVPEGAAAEWRAGFAGALRFRTLALHDGREGIFKSKGYMPAEALTPDRKKELKEALKAGTRLQKYVKKSVEGLTAAPEPG